MKVEPAVHVAQIRMCYVADSIIPSRTANSIHVMRMCQAYRRQNCDVQLVVPRWSQNLEKGVEDVFSFYGIETPFKVKMVPFNSASLRFLHRALLIPLVASRPAPSFAHSRNIAAAWGLCSVWKIPTILEIHDVPDPSNRLFHKVLASKRLIAVVVITRALADRIRHILPETTPCLVLADGVSQDALEHQLSLKEARSLTGLSSEKRRIVLYAGHLYKGRGIELIIDLAAKLPDHLFLVIGGNEQHLSKLRAETSAIANLRFIGFLSPAEIHQFLQSADVLLMPYSHQVEVRRGGKGGNTAAVASPMKMFEYMAARRPILASDLPVLQEVLVHERNALLIPYEAPEAWFSALLRLKNDDQLARGLSDQAFQDAKEYTWEQRARKILEFVKSQQTISR